MRTGAINKHAYLSDCGRPIDRQRKHLSQVLHALLTSNRLTRSLTGAGVCLGALAANGQTDTVTNASVALDFTKATNILRHLATKRPFDRVITLEHDRNAAELFFG
jgi:hypothetical protein